MRGQRLLCVALALALSGLSASSRIYCQSLPSPEPKNEFGLWAGYSFGNPHLFGRTSNRQLAVFGLRYGRALVDWGSVSLTYTLDVMPLELLRQPAFVPCGSPSTRGFCPEGRESVYGGGANPAGLRLTFFRRGRLRLFVGSSAGVVASVRPVPVDIPSGTELNFTFDFQGGIQLANSAGAWMLGYKYQHISNANRSDVNPGMDVDVVFLGYSFFR